MKLHNQQHRDIRGLEVTNTAPATGTPGATLKDLRGIHICGDNYNGLPDIGTLWSTPDGTTRSRQGT